MGGITFSTVLTTLYSRKSLNELNPAGMGVWGTFCGLLVPAAIEGVINMSNADRIRAPLIIVHGSNDPRVPVSESIQMVKALRAANRPVWYMNALNEGHGYRKKENRDIYQQATVVFLKEYLVGE